MIKLNCYPTDSRRITSPYGMRGDRFHNGIDIAEAKGHNIYATHSGTVAKTGFDPSGYGYYIILNDLSGFSTLYAHLDHIRVNTGDTVKYGEVIGFCGSTGHSTGPHLHFEIRTQIYKEEGYWDKEPNNKRINAVDPLPYLEKPKYNDENLQYLSDNNIFDDPDYWESIIDESMEVVTVKTFLAALRKVHER